MVVTFLFDDYFALNSTLENLNANEHRNFLEDKANYINCQKKFQGSSIKFQNALSIDSSCESHTMYKKKSKRSTMPL
jgi:hypothetical protein